MDPLTNLLAPIFPQRVDVSTAFLLLRDYTRFHFPVIPYKRLLTKISEVDMTHGEIEETLKTWSEKLQLRAFVVPSPMAQPMSKFGVEEERDVEMYATVTDLMTAGLVMQDKNFEVKLISQCVGDHFWYHGAEYEVLTFLPVTRFANTDIILHYQFHATRYRGNSVTVMPCPEV